MPKPPPAVQPASDARPGPPPHDKHPAAPPGGHPPPKGRAAPGPAPWPETPQHQGDQAPLHLVLNPGSGAGSGHGSAEPQQPGPDTGPHRIGRHELHWHQPAHPGDLAATAARAVAAARASGGVVVALGGDGTINTVAAAASMAQVAMGVVARGTFNLFARQQGLAEDPQQALADIVQALDQAWLRPVQLGRVNGQLFLVNASLGLYPQLLADREAANRQWGRHPWVALAAGVASLMRPWRSRRYRLAWQAAPPAISAPQGPTGQTGQTGQTDPTPAQAQDSTARQREVANVSTLFVGNNALQWARLGLPDAEQVGQGALGVISLSPATRPTLARLLWRAALGRLGDEPLITRRTCQALEVSVPAGRRNRPVRVAFDGERSKMTLPLRFEVAPQALWLLAPPETSDAPSSTEPAPVTAPETAPETAPASTDPARSAHPSCTAPHAPAAPV